MAVMHSSSYGVTYRTPGDYWHHCMKEPSDYVCWMVDQLCQSHGNYHAQHQQVHEWVKDGDDHDRGPLWYFWEDAECAVMDQLREDGEMMF